MGVRGAVGSAFLVASVPGQDSGWRVFPEVFPWMRAQLTSLLGALGFPPDPRSHVVLHIQRS